MYVCDRCGRTWSIHPYSLVACPVCQAEVGRRCRRPSGHKGPAIDYHVEREQLALDLGLLTRCPGTSRQQRLFDDR